MIFELRDARSSTCGGKAGALGRLTRGGFPVPDGFVIPFEAHANDEPVPREPLHAALKAMGEPAVAVRSSASDEDGATSSAAGQYESFLGVRGADAVAEAIRACRASATSGRVTAYRGDADMRMAVLVQRLVDADVSGVMFTPSHGRDVTRIECSWGLGLGVVGGSVTPDAYDVAADGSVTNRIVDRRRPCLDDVTAVRLAALGRAVAESLGGPQDIEWAIDDEQIWILQSRPITVAPPDRVAQVCDTTPLIGVPGSRGVASGPARTVAGPADFGRVRPGDILVCPYTEPAWTPLLRIAAGVVTQTGGALSHAAIIAREYGIPAVLGVPDVMSLIRDGAGIMINGTEGTIHTEERS